MIVEKGLDSFLNISRVLEDTLNPSCLLCLLWNLEPSTLLLEHLYI